MQPLDANNELCPKTGNSMKTIFIFLSSEINSIKSEKTLLQKPQL